MNKLKAMVFYTGIAILVCGVALTIVLNDAERPMKIALSAMIGCGSGITGLGALLMVNPKMAKVYEINEKDERNIRLREKSGYTTWYITQFVLCVMVFVFLLLDYKVPCWIALGALLIHNGSFLVSLAIHSKKI